MNADLKELEAGSEVAVVGSGPAALAAAWNLISHGVKPTILDCGDTMPESASAAVEELRRSHGKWRDDLLKAVTIYPEKNSRGGVPKKLVFGSDFLHGKDRVHSPIINHSFVDPTFAKGGFTVGWGGAMLPIHELDMSSWPVARTDLQDGFREILSRIPFCGADDCLGEEFPPYVGQPHVIETSDQVADVLKRLSGLRRPNQFVSGRARVAIDKQACRHCGLCLTGCPFGAIQTFDAFFDGLIREGLVLYRQGVVVTRLEEKDGSVHVHAVRRNGNKIAPMRFERVFLAAGAINSTRIVLESQGRYDIDVEMLDSQKFAVPILVPVADDTSLRERNTLPSIFVDARLDGLEQHWTHLQVSPFSDFAQQQIEKRLKICGLNFHHLAMPLTRKMMIGWGGVHSDYSGRFKLKMLRAHKDGRPVLKIESRQGAKVKANVKAAIRGLSRLMRAKGVLMVGMGAMIGPPGSGFHFGGSLPMSAKPRLWNECDSQGKLEGWEKIHVIDSSVLPTIPATTMVLTIMANAWRIVENELR
jgi:choline dehydrogenase-like flavoprotein